MPDDIKSEPVANGNSSKIIDIVSPRKTLVLSERPTFRWNEVPGASSYSVSLMDGSETYWQQEVRGTEIVYPGNPPLKQGVSYSLVIKSDNDFSSESHLDKSELKFNLLDPESAQKIESKIEWISKQGLKPEVEALVSTTLYIEHGLNAKAVKTLEKLRVDGTQAFAVDRTLSKLYQHIGLNVLSEERSKTARELETASNVTETDLLEQKVVGLQQNAANIFKEEGASLLRQQNASFFVCLSGDPCITDEGQRGRITYNPFTGQCLCRRVGGG